MPQPLERQAAASLVVAIVLNRNRGEMNRLPHPDVISFVPEAPLGILKWVDRVVYLQYTVTELYIAALA